MFLRCAEIHVEGREHFHGVLKELHVFAAHFLEIRNTGNLGEYSLHVHAFERLADLFTKLLLVFHESVQRVLEVVGHQGLDVVAVKADQVLHEADREQVVVTLGFLIDDDLGKDGTG